MNNIFFFRLGPVLFFGGVLLPINVKAQVPAPASTPVIALATPLDDAKSAELFGKAMAAVRSNYVTNVDETALSEAALKGMMGALDSHSSYMDPKQYANFTTTLAGTFSGIGLTIGENHGKLEAVSPIDGTPAARAGIEPGAIITEIDGKSTTGLSVGDAVEKIRGTTGTSVSLTLQYAGKQQRIVKMIRAKIAINSVYARMIGNILYVRITQFEASTSDDFTKALTSVPPATVPGMSGMILDLRNDPGGIFGEGIDVASRLLPAGDDVVLSGKDVQHVHHEPVRSPSNLLAGIPLVVLVNNGTASAAEIVASALQANHRALVVGMTSWGKGLVQIIVPLDEGKAGALAITTVRYYTPAGRAIQRVGVVPDLQVARSVDEVKNALDLTKQGESEGTMPHALDNDEHDHRAGPRNVEIPSTRRTARRTSSHHGKPAALPLLFRHSLPDASDIASDFQLRRAIDVLKFGSIAKAQAQRPAAIYPATRSPSGLTPTLGTPVFGRQ